MKHVIKEFVSATKPTMFTETRDSGLVSIVKQEITVPSGGGELSGITNVLTGNSVRSRKITISEKVIPTEVIKGQLDDLNVIQIISNRPINISATSDRFQKQVEFQQMKNSDGETITNSDDEQLFHIFALSPDAQDVTLIYDKSEKTAELHKANEILGIELPLETEVPNVVATDTF